MCIRDSPALREHITVIINVNGERFKAFGMRTVRPEWMEFYGRYAKLKEQVLPEMEANERIENPEIRMNEKETSPPPRYSQASILKLMEEKNLGTKATRAQILQTLYEREYIRDKSIKVTALGSAVIRALEKHCPEIISEELTRRFEREMEMIQNGEKKREEVVEEARRELEKILRKFREHEIHIGSELKEGVKEFQEISHYIGVCPKCGGELRILHSHTSKKYFVGCSNYPKCKQTYPLPQKGKITVLDEKCGKCGLNIIQIKPFRRRPWKLCVNCGFVVKREKGKS